MKEIKLSTLLQHHLYLLQIYIGLELFLQRNWNKATLLYILLPKIIKSHVQALKIGTIHFPPFHYIMAFAQDLGGN